MKKSNYLVLQTILIIAGVNIFAGSIINSDNDEHGKGCFGKLFRNKNSHSIKKEVKIDSSINNIKIKIQPQSEQHGKSEIDLDIPEGNDDILDESNFKIEGNSLQDKSLNDLLEERSQLYADQRESMNKSVETSKASERQAWICKINEELEFRGKQSEAAKQQIAEADKKEEEESNKFQKVNQQKRELKESMEHESDQKTAEPQGQNNSGNVPFLTKIRNGFFNFFKTIACCFYTAE